MSRVSSGDFQAVAESTGCDDCVAMLQARIWAELPFEVQPFQFTDLFDWESIPRTWTKAPAGTYAATRIRGVSGTGADFDVVLCPSRFGVLLLSRFRDAYATAARQCDRQTQNSLAAGLRAVLARLYKVRQSPQSGAGYVPTRHEKQLLSAFLVTPHGPLVTERTLPYLGDCAVYAAAEHVPHVTETLTVILE